MTNLKVIILGASGLIGHTLLRELSKDFDVYGVLHKPKEKYNSIFFDAYKTISNIDVLQIERLRESIKGVNPDVILNCTGITTRKINKNNIPDAISLNAAFPHKLAWIAKETNSRVIHFSTDCVFNGKIGNHKEMDTTDADNIYGRTKALGELKEYDNCLTLRSSFIGQELFDKTELLDWFLAQEGNKIKGYRKTLYSGVSTIFMTTIVKKIILDHPTLHGLFNLAPPNPISKYDLLGIAKKEFCVNVEIVPDDYNIHSPTLDGSRLRNKLNINIPNWQKMMSDLARHKLDYK